MPLDQVDVDEMERRQNSGEMSFFDHVDVLRKHILRSVAAIFVFGAFVFVHKDFVFERVIFGPKNADFPTFKALCWVSENTGMGRSMCFEPTQFKVVSRELGEFFMMHITVSFWLGLVCAFPYLLWEVWRFISPGLYEHERRAATGAIAVCSGLFMLGVLFGYYIIAPFSINFLAGYAVQGAEVTPTLESYVSYMTMFTIPTGLIFELPVVSYFLARLGVLGPKFMRTYRRHAIVIIFIVAAVITPPDVVSQTLVALPLLVLYEVSIGVAARVERDKAMAERADSNLPQAAN